MRLLTWTLRFILFLVVVAAAAKNVEPVVLRFFFELSLQAPLVLVLLGAFALGALFGVAALLGTVLRQRREISSLRRAVEPAPPPA